MCTSICAVHMQTMNYIAIDFARCEIGEEVLSVGQGNIDCHKVVHIMRPGEVSSVGEFARVRLQLIYCEQGHAHY